MVIDYSDLGKKIARIRRERRLTQQKLAEKTDLANNYISNIETGRSIPSLETFIKLCEALEITPDKLLIGSTTTHESYLLDETYTRLMRLDARDRRVVAGLIDALEKEKKRKPD